LFELAREASIKVQEAQWLEQVAAKNKETLASLHSKLQGNQKTKQKELHKKQEAIASLKVGIGTYIGWFLHILERPYGDIFLLLSLFLTMYRTKL